MNPSSKNRNSRTYANVTQTQKSSSSKRDQVIVIDAIEELPLADYVISVGSIIVPRNILLASKISNNRVCLYLAKQLAEDLAKNYWEIIIAEKVAKLRKLISSAKRIIISNVYSSIPHYVLENALKLTGYFSL